MRGRMRERAVYSRYSDETILEALRDFHGPDRPDIKSVASKHGIKLGSAKMILFGQGSPRYKALYDRVSSEMEIIGYLLEACEE